MRHQPHQQADGRCRRGGGGPGTWPGKARRSMARRRVAAESTTVKVCGATANRGRARASRRPVPAVPGRGSRRAGADPAVVGRPGRRGGSFEDQRSKYEIGYGNVYRPCFFENTVYAAAHIRSIAIMVRAHVCVCVCVCVCVPAPRARAPAQGRLRAAVSGAASATATVEPIGPCVHRRLRHHCSGGTASRSSSTRRM